MFDFDFIISIFLALQTYFLSKTFKKGPDSPITESVTIKTEKNPNTLNTFLSVVVSIISMFGIVDNPIPTLIIIIAIYCLLYKLVLKTTEYYPNITLTFIGWSGLVGYTKDHNLNKVPVWVFYRSESLDNEKFHGYNNIYNVRLFGECNGTELRMGLLDTNK